MPIRNISLRGEVKGPDGKIRPVKPSAILQGRGPIVQVNIHLGERYQKKLSEEGTPLPPPVTGFALIDTGASASCVDESVVEKLKIPATGTCKMHSATNMEDRTLHEVSIEIANFMKLNTDHAVSCKLDKQEIVALIGRDILSVCVLIYNGRNGTLTLAH